MTHFSDTVTIEGNLGVNVNSAATVPGAQVQVGDLAKDPSDGRIRLIAKAGAGNRSWEIGTASGTGYAYGFAIRDVSPGTPLDRLHIDFSTGNVGIGVVNGSERLTVTGGNLQLQDTSNSVTRSIGARFTLAASAPASSQLQVGIRNQNHANYGASVRFAYEGTTNGAANTDAHLAFWTMKNGSDGGAERMRISALGNVGIGTSAPDARLHIAGGGGTGNDDSKTGLRMTTPGDPVDLRVFADAVRTGAGFVGVASGVHALRFYTGGTDYIANTRMFIGAEGRIGIARIDPGARLDIQGGGTSGGESDAERGIRMTAATVDMRLFADMTKIGAAFIGTKSNHSLRFYAYSDGAADYKAATKMTILTNGNVGIGTDNPELRLQVGSQSAPGSDGRIRLGAAVYPSGAARTWDVGPSSDPALSCGFAIADQSAGQVRLFITPDANGNVGIGTTGPQAKLHISGPYEPNARALQVNGPPTGNGEAVKIVGDLLVEGYVYCNSNLTADKVFGAVYG